MARQIIVLDVSAGQTLDITCALWLTVPAALVRAAPNATSAVLSSSSVSWGITAAELAALQAGTTREVVEVLSMAVGSTAAQAKALAQAAFTDQQNALNGKAPATHWIGAFFDGTTWTAGP